MTNPISPTGATQIPPSTEPIVDPDTGIATPNWYRWALATFTRTGGSSGSDITIISAIANQALSTSITAANLAGTANTAATHAQTTANSGLSLATLAENNATSGLSSIVAINATALFSHQNLANLTSQPDARANLGVDSQPIFLTVDSALTITHKYLPMVRTLTFVTNLTGSAAYCAIVPTATVVCTLGYIRGGVTYSAASITFFAGGHIGFFSAQPSFSVLNGDILTLTVPADATMAGIGFTLNATLG